MTPKKVSVCGTSVFGVKTVKFRVNYRADKVKCQADKRFISKSFLLIYDTFDIEFHLVKFRHPNQ